jgi:hypothetical protein
MSTPIPKRPLRRRLASLVTAAQITFGAALSGTQFDATASVPGTFAYAPPAGTVLQPGTQTLTATFTPTDTTDYTTNTITTQIPVGFTGSCITTAKAGPLTIASDQALCIGSGGSVNGSITINAGGALHSTGGAINGTIKSTGAAAVALCASTLAGPLTFTNTAGPVLFGGAGCARDTVNGPVTITGTTGAVSYTQNADHGPVITITNNTGAVAITGNSISGSLTATGNTGGFQDTGNTVTAPAPYVPRHRPSPRPAPPAARRTAHRHHQHWTPHR